MIEAVELNADSFFRDPPKEISVLKVQECIAKTDGRDIGYLSLADNGHPGLGLRIRREPMIEDSELGVINLIKNQPDYLGKYFELAFMKTSRTRTLISEVLSAGIHEQAANGVTIETPNLFGYALINQSTGATEYFPFSSGATAQAKLVVTTTMLVEQAKRMQKDERWIHASIVSHAEGIDNPTIYRSIGDCFDPAGSSQGYIEGIDALQSSSHLVWALKKRGLINLDPEINHIMYSPDKKMWFCVDIGSFGFTNETSKQIARNFIHHLTETTGIKNRMSLSIVLDDRNMFYVSPDADTFWEKAMQLDEIRSRIRFMSALPNIVLRDFSAAKKQWEMIRNQQIDMKHPEKRLSLGQKLVPFDSFGGVDLLFIDAENASRDIAKYMSEMIRYAGKDLFLVNSGKNAAQRALEKMTQTHQKLIQVFTSIF